MFPNLLEVATQLQNNKYKINGKIKNQIIGD